MVRLIKMFSVMVMVLVLSSVVYTDEFTKLTLKGLKGVDVIVEGLNPDIEKDGLHKSSIQTDVELKLRMAGIKVLTEEESLKESGMPYLYVNVNSGKIKTGFYVYSILVELKQAVFLSRDVNILCMGSTWSPGSIGILGAD